MKPNPFQIEEARRIVTHADALKPGHPDVQCAWATLKEARGQPVNFATLPAVAHAAPPQATTPLDITSPGVMARIHTRAAENGIDVERARRGRS